ncbi:DNA/RNA polymerase [Coprinopsis marcescibilis]|uniref:DNA polymerase kappa n=1 Tax=Coprinopsis marcescibilis TaxID=230819 RepID=A0A5C3L0R1_COPMA|nr:DNA/RNA polymerase [Coprinopsis marcescibilis]
MSSSEAPQASQQTESLLRRLAGASVTKAGLTRDQNEVNQIIAEASKGSKFYENEKRKDKDLTERISRILQERDAVLHGADIRKIEAQVDQIIAEMEDERDLTQFIVHVDMDAFFANVEVLRDPSLGGKPFIVGGGVVSTASYEARKFGVRSGMAGFIARKLCPGLITVKSHYDLYNETSGRIMNIFRRYDATMCPAGCDEAYLNITNYCVEHCKPVEEVVSEMRQVVFEETRLTVSAGIAPNKMLAKICSDKNKPNGQFKLDFDAESLKQFMHDLPIRKIPGIGRVNERLLDSIGIKTCGDIYFHRGLISLMDKQFGLIFLLRTYLGISSNHVEPHAREERKSIGAERTFSSISSTDLDPKTGELLILTKLNEVAEELETDMNREGWVGKTVTLKFKLDTYQTFTRAKSFGRWVTTKDELYNTGKELLLPEFPLRIRLIGLRLTKLKDLNAAETKPIGIKRFFESVKQEPTEKEGNPARKRIKLDPNQSSEEAGLNEQDQEEGIEEESMPGYHEHNEEEAPFSQPEVEDNDEFEEESFILDEGKAISRRNRSNIDSKRPRPPVSAPAGSQPQPPHSPIKDIGQNRSKSTGPSLSTMSQVNPRAAAELLECPICGKKLETDNQGLNTHIDFCLSRGAIWDAQGETIAASTSTTATEAVNHLKRKEKGKPPDLGSGNPPKKSKVKTGAIPSKDSNKQGMFNWVTKR